MIMIIIIIIIMMMMIQIPYKGNIGSSLYIFRGVRLASRRFVYRFIPFKNRTCALIVGT